MGLISIDYDDTMEMAQKLTSVNELLQDAKDRDAKMQSCFASWEGEAATAARQTLEELHETLSSFEGIGETVIGHFISSAEDFTHADEKGAAEIEASF
jgi:uncharacterized protein YukE